MRMEQAIAAIRFEPVLPLWLLAGLALLCLLAVGVALGLRARGTGWRIMAFAVLLLWLSGPRVVEETREGLPDIALLVVDESASMQVGNRAALAERARASIEAQARALPRLELRSVSVPEAGSEGTKLFAANPGTCMSSTTLTSGRFGHIIHAGLPPHGQRRSCNPTITHG